MQIKTTIRTKDIKLHSRYLSITINIKDKQKEVFFPRVTKIHFIYFFKNFILFLNFT